MLTAFDLACYATRGEPAESAAYVDWLALRVRNMLRHPIERARLDAVARALLDRHSLNRADIMAVVAAATDRLLLTPGES